MRKKDIVYIKLIRDAIDPIIDYTKGFKKSDFISKTIVQNAVIRKIQIIGEVIKNVSTIFRERDKEVLWMKIAGMRDKIIHGYFNIDIDLKIIG